MVAPSVSSEHLRPSASLDADHPSVVAFAQDAVAGVEDERERAVALYLAVRDGFRYDPYAIDQTPAGFRASTLVARGSGYCVPKATLLAASARAVGIPARVGYADVRNHLSSPRLARMLGDTDVFVFHGYAQLHVEGRWVKATPAFNASLCEKIGIEPLAFDGREDSLFQQFDRSGRQHMEYVQDRGTFSDVPVDTIVATWRAAYPHSASWPDGSPESAAAFERDAHGGG
ncbi:transglutaminase-like domain-containing protein [Patulibacter minatonensis]|uniref:transglutaminase-like domain-containing protein n=1 Tax=Patulibacter minatonensis TaxID=298163 RepID=UPI00047E52DE|nr:transglutaminase family protein [Patulibacter minatonensis]